MVDSGYCLHNYCISYNNYCCYSGYEKKLIGLENSFSQPHPLEFFDRNNNLKLVREVVLKILVFYVAVHLDTLSSPLLTGSWQPVGMASSLPGSSETPELTDLILETLQV